jgi:hypothetical protein
MAGRGPDIGSVWLDEYTSLLHMDRNGRDVDGKEPQVEPSSRVFLFHRHVCCVLLAINLTDRFRCFTHAAVSFMLLLSLLLF